MSLLMGIDNYTFGHTFVTLLFGHCEKRLHRVHGRRCTIQGRFGHIVHVHCACIQGAKYPDSFCLCQCSDIDTLNFSQPAVNNKSIDIA